MTLSLLTGPLNPSLKDLNTLIRQMNALFVNVSVAGDEAVSGNLAVTGTTALTGNATAAGTVDITGLLTANGGLVGGGSANIAINTNKFTVAAASGNTLIAGTAAITGAVTMAGALTVGTNITQTSGNLLLSSGNATLTAGNLLLTLGNATLTAGNLILTLGNLTVTNGAVLHTTGNHTMTNGHFLNSTANALSGAGTTRADATALTKQVNNITTVASGTGAVLPTGVVGMEVTVFNGGANVLQVYAAGSETIDGTAGSTGVALTNAKRCKYFFTATNTWVSAQMGVVSA